MDSLPSPKLQRSNNHSSRLLIYCLLGSLTLHVLMVVALTIFSSSPPVNIAQQPTIVRLIDRPKTSEQPQSEKPAEFEIDQQPQLPVPQEPVESFRKAERDQRVIKEEAPRGEDVRDQSVAKPSAQQRPQPIPPTTPRQPAPATKSTSKIPQDRSLAPDENKKSPMPSPSAPAPQLTPEASPPLPLLTPEQLRPDLSTLDQIARGETSDRERVKQRDDVDIGDTIWLNLQHDLLVSFFRRFHDQIERVWNYPPEAAQAGIEGTLELLIVVNKQGELLDVDLRQSSGSDILDFEAIQAVYRAAPFGPLGKHYPHEQLNIRAHFRYTIVGKYIYGR